MSINVKADFNNAPAGYRYVPMIITKEQIKDWELDPKFVTYHRIGATLHLCYMVPIEEEKYPSYMADLKAEDKRRERERRCLIESPKTGQLIMCPESNRCYGCPNADKEHLITEPLSLDSLMEDSHWEPVGDDDTSRKAMAKIGAEEFFEYLKKTEPKYIEVYKLVLKHYTVADISEQTGLSKKSIYNYLERIEKLHDQFDAE